jgi:GPH family glycoside/pentoside/hexuronide:cation symporter
MKNLQTQLGPRDYLAYGSGDMAINISMIAASMLIYAFHIQVVGLTPMDAGWILLGVRLIDAVSDPAMGWLTGKVGTKHGRFLPWILIGSIPLGLSLYFMFTTIEGDYHARFIWAFSTYAINTIMFTIITIPYISLVGAITNDPAERLAANTYRFTMAKAATLLVTTFAPYWVASSIDAEQGYNATFVILSTISVLCLVFCATNVKEHVTRENSTENIVVQFKSLIKNDQFLILSLSMVLLLVGFLVRGSLAIIYGKEFAGATESWSIALFMSMWSVGGFLAAIISRKLTKKYCKVRVYRYSLYGAGVISACAFFFVGHMDLYTAIIFYFLNCLISDINTPILWASITEAADYGHKKTGVNASGLTMGSIALTFIGYSSGEELSEYTLQGLSAIMTLVPAIFFVLSGLIMKKYVINNDYYLCMMLKPTLVPSKLSND